MPDSTLSDQDQHTGDETETNSTWCLELSASKATSLRLMEHLAQMEFDEFPAISISEMEDKTSWKLQAYFEHKPDLAKIETALLELVDPLPHISLVLMPTKDWVAHVQSELSPVRAGRYLIHGSHDRALTSGRTCEIEIEAGQAFGTAHHDTTKGCLLALDHLFKRNHVHKMRSVLDLGTGTGLLAIAAARTLKRPILASDIDPISVRIVLENAALNEVGPLLNVVEATGLSHPQLAKNAPYDLMIANILAAPLLDMAPDIRQKMRRGGTLILSGLLQTQARSIKACYRQHGFTSLRQFPLGEWMTLVLKFDPMR